MQNKPTYKFEFIALMASLMSIVALSIDALLPALPEIGSSLGVVDVKDNQLMITMIFLGLGFGQLVFGPLSDSFGRKPMVYFGFSVFVIASIICVNTESLEVMIFGRIRLLKVFNAFLWFLIGFFGFFGFLMYFLVFH